MPRTHHGADLRSLFVVSLPRSLSSLLYEAAAVSLGLAQPGWTTDGEILNRDRVPRRLHDRAPADERFTLLGSAPDAFADMTEFLDEAAGAGVEVLVGDPGREYLPRKRVEALATYDVPGTADLEGRAVTPTTVHRLR